MKVVIDIEANGLENPDKVWLIVCKDIDTGELHVFKEVSDRADEAKRFLDFAASVSLWVGHNWLEYDYPVLHRLIGLSIPDVASCSVDTLIISRMVDYSRTFQVRERSDADAVEGSVLGTDDADPGDGARQIYRSVKGHSIESYGVEFEFPKIEFHDWTKYSQEMETYCVRDVEICHKIYDKYRPIIVAPDWAASILLEHRFQIIVNSLHQNGFAFNQPKATTLLKKVTAELSELDVKIHEAFPPREVLIREFTPKLTKFGTISRTSVPRVLWDKIANYEPGRTYRHTSLVDFNPASHKQLIDVLTEAGWQPTDKTKTHIEYLRNRSEDVDKGEKLKKYGWKINETNLSTLPDKAPQGARLLAKRILLESRRRTLTEWLALVDETDRIHGRFYGIGAWTHRMAHQEPNTANIPNELDTQGKKKLLGKEMRALWCAPKGRLLVGVDAEGIQLRIFAHYINDEEFTDALVNGKKADKSDPHSLNQRILGSICKSRQAAKRFIYALLLGAGIGKLSEVLDASVADTEKALDRLLQRYSGWEKLRTKDIPRDAKRGYFIGLDGRQVKIPGDDVGKRKHLAMSGYLQNGEAVCMKLATTLFFDKLGEYDAKLVNFVHDEWQTECPNNVDVALRIADLQSQSLRLAGEELELRCPLAGSYYNDDLRDYTIGTNWSVTH